MGREVRKVPADWEHPKHPNGNHTPLYGGSYAEATSNWDEGNAMWANGLKRSYEKPPAAAWVSNESSPSETYVEYAGARPVPEHYMPDWPEQQRTHFMMYEDTSEGTPISPAFATAEDLARWLTDTGASAFGSMTADYEAWLRVCRGGFAPSAVLSMGGIQSGVQALADEPNPELAA